VAATISEAMCGRKIIAALIMTQNTADLGEVICIGSGQLTGRFSLCTHICG
jgi:hypothetical protein